MAKKITALLLALLLTLSVLPAAMAAGEEPAVSAEPAEALSGSAGAEAELLQGGDDNTATDFASLKYYMNNGLSATIPSGKTITLQDDLVVGLYATLTVRGKLVVDNNHELSCYGKITVTEGGELKVAEDGYMGLLDEAELTLDGGVLYVSMYESYFREKNAKFIVNAYMYVMDGWYDTDPCDPAIGGCVTPAYVTEARFQIIDADGFWEAANCSAQKLYISVFGYVDLDLPAAGHYEILTLPPNSTLDISHYDGFLIVEKGSTLILNCSDVVLDKENAITVYGKLKITKSASVKLNAENAIVKKSGGSYTRTTRRLEHCTVKLSSYSYTYTGSARKPTVTVKTRSGKKLTRNVDFKVTYTDNVNAGGDYYPAGVIVKGIGSYTGTVFEHFSIFSRDVSKLKISLSKTKYVCNGSERKPSVTVKYGTKTLKLNRDYLLSYRHNVNPGTAMVDVIGCGNYGGTVTREYDIVPPTPEIKSLKGEWVEPDGDGNTLAFDPTDYTQKYYIYRNGYFIANVEYDESSFHDVGFDLENGKKYTYRMTAEANGAESAKSNSRSIVYLKCPGINNAEPAGTGKYKVSWNRNSKASGYQIEWSTDFDFNDAERKTVTSGKTTYKTWTIPDGAYLRVRAYKTVNGKKYYSAWSPKGVQIGGAG